MEDDVYIKLLKQGKERLESGKHMTYGEFKGIISVLKIKRAPGTLFREIYGPPLGEDREEDICLDAYFNLLEYEELKQARESSKSASKLALWAIGIAIVTLLTSIGFSTWGIFTCR